MGKAPGEFTQHVAGLILGEALAKSLGVSERMAELTLGVQTTFQYLENCRPSGLQLIVIPFVTTVITMGLIFATRSRLPKFRIRLVLSPANSAETSAPNKSDSEPV